jgi:hypothetical protein
MNFESVKKLVQDYEANILTAEQAVEEINKLSVKPVDIEWLMSYWNAIDMDEFVELLTLPEIQNWNELTDEESIEIIKEAISFGTSNAVFQRNAEALEKRYRKPEGTLSGFVHQDDNPDPNEILKLLKKDTTFYL